MKNSVCTGMIKKKNLFDNPIHLGFLVLEVSKLLMYEFYYHTPKSYWQDKVKLPYKDIVLRFDTNREKLLEFQKQNENEINFSELDKSYELFDSNF